MTDPTGVPSPALPEPLALLQAPYVPAKPAAPPPHPAEWFTWQAATVSAAAPVASVVLALVGVPVCLRHPGAAKFFAFAGLLLSVGGLALATAVLVGTRRRRIPEIMRRTIAGVVFNALLAACTIIGVAGRSASTALASKGISFGPRPAAAAPAHSNAFASQSKPKPTAVKPDVPEMRINVADLQKIGDRTFATYAGWLGVRRAGGVVVIVTSLDDADPTQRALRSALASSFSSLRIVIDNGTSHAVSIDPKHAWLWAPDDMPIRPLDPIKVAETAKSNRPQWLAHYGRPIVVPGGAKLSKHFLFLPRSTDLKSLCGVTLLIDGKTVDVKGRYLSAAEKAALLSREGSGAR